MSTAGRAASRTVARGWFAVQAGAGALWWVAVFASDDVRRWTLGTLDPAYLVGPDLVLLVGASGVAALARPRARLAAVAAAIWTVLVTASLGVWGLLERQAGAGVVLMAVSTLGTVAATATLWTGRLPTRWFFVGPFSFRVADERPGHRHLRRSLVQLVVFWSAFFLAVPLVLGAVEERLRLDWPALDRPLADLVGVVVFVAASGVGLWSCVTMALVGHGTPLPAETARELVVAGPYRWVRNPMALAGVLQTTAVGLWVGSWMVAAIGVGGAVVWNVLIRPEEEADLAARFGAPYQRYADAVRCWVPTVRR